MKNISDSITPANQNFMDAFKRGDAAGIAALHTEDTKLLTPGFPMRTGKEAVQFFRHGVMNMGIKEARACYEP